MGTPLGVERGEERRAQAVLGEDMPSKRRMARMVLVGGEKEARGEVGPSCCWDQCCNNTGKYISLNQQINQLTFHLFQNYHELLQSAPVFAAIHCLIRQLQLCFHHFLAFPSSISSNSVTVAIISLIINSNYAVINSPRLP